MGCSNEILFGFTLPTIVPTIVEPYIITPSGTYNDKSYYIWFDATTEITFIIRWDNIGEHWVLGKTTAPYLDFNFIALLGYNTPTDCPVDPTDAFGWIVIGGELSAFNTSLGNPLPNEPTPEQECYPILVWNKQCEFAQATLNYLQKMQFGIFCCESLDKLKNKRRALEILNCYDVRDIPNNTTDYNTLTYQQIKNLLNS